MANFNPAFGTNGDFRYPSSTERDQGFPCGPLDKDLFNGLYYRIESELKSVIDAGGISHTDTDHTLVLQAINALISAATGGSPSDYILMSQAEARLPIFPQIGTTDGKMGITSPATGTVRLPGSVTFLHRGIGQYTTSLNDFATVGSKTYHLRWDFATDTYSLEDLSDSGYNPSALAESDSSFDSSYDDMLIARVVTNSSNVATITDLINLDRLFHHEVVTGTNWRYIAANFSTCDFTFNYNWARTPKTKAFSVVQRGNVGNIADADQLIYTYGQQPEAGVTLADFPATRYRSQFSYLYDYSSSLAFGGDFAA